MLYWDLEADNLLYAATKIHTGVAFDDENGMYHLYVTGPCIYPINSYVYTDIKQFMDVLSTAKEVCSFNGLGYDLPLLKKLHGFEYSLDNQVDCLLLSRLYYPDRAGHSLEYFGQLLGFPKGNHSDWSCFSQAMLDYCLQDVLVLQKVYHYLNKEGEGWDWTEAIRLEKRIQDIQVRQEMKGCLFDTVSAKKLSDKISEELTEIEIKIMTGIPKRPVQIGAIVEKPFKKSGDYTEAVKKWMIGK